MAFNVSNIVEYVGHIAYFHDACAYCVLLGQNLIHFTCLACGLKNPAEISVVSSGSPCEVAFGDFVVLMSSCFDTVILRALFL